MENLPIYINTVFGLTTAATVYIFYKASGNSKLSLICIIAWLIIQGVISSTEFYTNTSSIPPRFLLLLLPPVLLILGLFLTKSGRTYVDNFNPKMLTLVHLVRIPVEIVLFCLFVNNMIPELMTFEGRNFDILSGISAPLVYYFGYYKNKIGTKYLLLWNFVCLGLLFNIVSNAVLSAPFPFQQFGFEQPNIAVFYFPFVWLPCCIVPIVLFSHLVCIRLLFQQKLL